MAWEKSEIFFIKIIFGYCDQYFVLQLIGAVNEIDQFLIKGMGTVR